MKKVDKQQLKSFYSRLNESDKATYDNIFWDKLYKRNHKSFTQLQYDFLKSQLTFASIQFAVGAFAIKKVQKLSTKWATTQFKHVRTLALLMVCLGFAEKSVNEFVILPQLINHYNFVSDNQQQQKSAD